MLLDPIVAERIDFLKREINQPIKVNDLPNIDYVIISHNHFDHLHIPTIKKLNGNQMFLVPLGVKCTLLKSGILSNKIVECHWWDSIKDENCSITFTFVPARHWSGRGLFNENQSLWGGWVMKTNAHCIYFAGDTGYTDEFLEIGEKFPIDYALLPIGAYEPRWLSEQDHMCPEEAVRAFFDLEATYFIPMHYGTFRLGYESGVEALTKLHNEWKKRNLSEQQLAFLKPGETIILK